MELPEGSPLDDVARDLQLLRVAAGAPSYAEIVQRITRQRVARGKPEAAARPARTTVYDAFRAGRRRLDVALVLDIVEALGAGPDEVRAWGDRCRAAQETGSRPAPVPAPTPGPTPGPTPAPTPPPAEPARATVSLMAHVAYSDGWTSLTWTARTRAAVVVGSVAANLLGRALVDGLHLPLYLDMVGTAVAAVVLGPWWGAAVGVSTNLTGVLVSGPASIPFVVVNVVGALVWGYGVRSFGWGRTIPRYFALNVAVGLACTTAAVPIILLVFDGATSHGTDDVTSTMLSLGANLLVAVLSVNVLVSVVDKVISGFVALVVLELLVTRRDAPSGRPASPVPPNGGARRRRPSAQVAAWRLPVPSGSVRARRRG